MIDTLFQFGNLNQNLIIYLFIHDIFYKYQVIIKQYTL